MHRSRRKFQRPRNLAAMTKAVYTHKPAVMREHARRVFAFACCSSASRKLASSGNAADTHEFPLIRTSIGVRSALRQRAGGIHAYLQSMPAHVRNAAWLGAFPAKLALNQRLLPLGINAVYTYKQQAGSLGTPGSPAAKSAVYTHKQQAVCGAPTPGAAGGRLPPPPTVYTHKHPQPNPAQSGVRCVWGLLTGELP